MNIPKDTKIFIIEGVPGSGKTTLHQQLKEALNNKTVYDFHEEELLFSWKHGWIPGIDRVRLKFMEHFLDYVEKILSEDAQAVFVLNRFHITYFFISSKKFSTSGRYKKIVKRLQALPTHIYVPMLSVAEMESRASHLERNDVIWKKHLTKRLAQRGFTTLKDMYSDEQEKTKLLLKGQKISYSIISVKAPNF